MNNDIKKNSIDRWIINTPNTATKEERNKKEPSEQIKEKNDHLENNILVDELSGWVGEIPGIIGEKKIECEMPEVIKTPISSLQTTQKAFNKNNDKHPKDNTSKKELLQTIERDESLETFWAVDDVKTTAKNEQVFNEEHIVSRVKELLLKELEVLVKQYCLKTVEKTAWEVIPDLAENLIKQEIQEITKSTEDSSIEDVHSSKPSRPLPSQNVLHP